MESEKNHKERDHVHLRGKFLRAVHFKCNFNRQFPTKIPVFCHNLLRYDVHLFIRNLFRHEVEILTIVLATTDKSYISIKKNIMEIKLRKHAEKNGKRGKEYTLLF